MQDMFTYLSSVYGHKINFGDRLTENDLYFYHKYLRDLPMWNYIDKTIQNYDPFNSKYNYKFYQLGKFKQEYMHRSFRFFRPYNPSDKEYNYNKMLSIKWRWIRLGYISFKTPEIFILSSMASVIWPEHTFHHPFSAEGMHKYLDIFKKDYLKTNHNLNQSIQSIIQNKQYLLN